VCAEAKEKVSMRFLPNEENQRKNQSTIVLLIFLVKVRVISIFLPL